MSDEDIHITTSVDTGGVKALGDASAALKAKFDALQAAMKSLNEQASSGSKGFDQLAAAIKAAEAAAAAASSGQAKMAAGLNQVKTAAAGAHTGMSGLIRETIVLAREASTGNFTRLAGSFSLWEQRLLTIAPALVPVTLGVGALAAVVAGAAYEAEKGAEAQAAFNAAIRATGDYAGTSAGEFALMTDKIAASTNTSRQAIRDLAMEVVRSGKVGNESMDLLISTSARFAKAFGVDNAEALKRLMNLSGDTSGEMVKLNESMHKLTIDQYEAIRAAESHGDKQKALKLALDDVNVALGHDAENLGWVARTAKDASTWLDTMVQSLNDMGKVPPPTGSLDAIDAKIKELQDLKKNNTHDGKWNWSSAISGAEGLYNSEGGDNAVAKLQAQRAKLAGALKTQTDATNKQADADAQSIAINDAVGKKTNELDDRRAQLTFTTKRLADEQARLNATTDAAAKASLAKAISLDQENKAGLNKRISQLQKQLAGPKGPADNPFDDERNQIANKTTGMGKNEALTAEIAFWKQREEATVAGNATLKALYDKGETDRLAVVTGGNVRLHDQYIKENDAQLAAQQKLDDAIEAARVKAAKVHEQVARLQAEGMAKIAEAQAAYERDQQEAVIDAEITALDDRMRVQNDYSAASITKLQQYYRDKAVLMIADAKAEAVAKSGQATSEFNTAANAEGGPDLAGEQRALNASADAWAQYSRIVLGINKAMDTSIVAAATKAADAQTAAWQKSAKTIGDAMRTTLEGLITKQKSWAQVGTELETAFLDKRLRDMQKWLTNAAAAYAKDASFHTTNNAVKAASDAAAAAAGKATSLQAALSQANNNAILAAQGAYASTMTFVPPPLNFVAAPAAATAAYAGTLGLGAFSAKGGMWEVPEDGTRIIAHAKEMVLPAQPAQQLRNLLGGVGQGGNSTTNSNTSSSADHYHIYPPKGSSLDDFTRLAKEAKRRGKLTAKDFGYA